MAASLVRRAFVAPTSTYSRFILCRKVHASINNKSSSSDSKSDSPEDAFSKFALLVDKVEKLNEEKMKREAIERDWKTLEIEKAEVPQVQQSFASMLRNSKLVSLGEYEGRLLRGNIIEVMDDDLYIDFGGKFHCCCPRPKKNGEKYKRGVDVLIQLRKFEMSSSFLGSDKHITLLEADAVLKGLLRRPKTTEDLPA